MSHQPLPRQKRGRELVWHDEFDGPGLDTAKWTFQRTMTGPDARYDNGGGYVEQAGGQLWLRVRKTGEAGAPYALPEGLTTKERMYFRYGYVEARLRIPYRHGAWPSFWMTTNTPYRQAGYVAEIDIFEVFSSPDTVVSNLHKWADERHVMLPGGEGSLDRAFTFPDSAGLNGAYHRYGMEWDAQNMTFYVDDAPYARFPIDEAHDFNGEIPGMQGFHDPAFLIFNDEIFTPNSRWKPEGAALRGDEPFPIAYGIDWVRLYQDPEKETLLIEPAARDL